MDRRVFLSGVCAAAAGPLLALPTFAQTSDVKPMPGQQTSAGEQAYIDRTLTVGSLSLLISRQALHTGVSPSVVEFAGFETNEQEGIADVLMSMMKNPALATGVVVKPTDAQAMAHVDAMGRAVIDRLSGLSGRRFDAAYVAAEIQGHTMLLRIQDDYLTTGHNREALNVAKLAKSRIVEHLQLLHDLQQGRTL